MRKAPALPNRPSAVPPTTPAPAPAAATEHLRNPTLAQALFSVWSGDAAVVIDSPPGAGKTHLITVLAHQLQGRAGMTVAIAAQTRAQAVDVANRTAATGTPTVFLNDTDKTRPQGLDEQIPVTSAKHLRTGSGVIVATTARWLWTPKNRVAHFDALLIDEAYQLTFSDLGALGAMADQFVLVGDPGQISPVVTGSTRRWAHSPIGPQVPAPQALIAAHGDDVARLRLPRTWRFGPDTADLLAPLYPDLPFTSARPLRHIAQDGIRLPEYRAIPVPATGGTADPRAIQTATDTIRALLTATLHTPDSTGILLPEDLALIVPHVEQAALAAAHLADLPDVFVGTINQAQGLQREAVVAVHPMLGHDTDEAFALDLGRLCVALSRHRSHVTVVTDQESPARLSAALQEHPGHGALAAQTTILDHLLSGARLTV
ncbi:AAA family ATPase [Microbacterium panaciterrae]|uniref:AAA family ATPase n=1 Tax=Microbacterium panaciterrae TaxID=985759 RepID=A0ABP8PV95_9MICO